MAVQGLCLQACHCRSPQNVQVLRPVSLQVNAMSLAGKKVYVGPFQKKSERPADGEVRFTNVYVKNLPDSVDDDRLSEMFGEFGSVTSAVVMKVSRDMPAYLAAGVLRLQYCLAQRD